MSPDRVTRAYRVASRRRDRLWTAANGCFDGLWLGLLDRRALAVLDEGFYSNGHDVLDGRSFAYADDEHNLSGLQAWEAAAVDAHFAPGARVVVTGAGGGREVLALLERGFDAIGYEPNASLVAAGSRLLERRGHAGRLLPSERDGFPRDAAACDAVVLGWGSYMLIPGRARRVELLRAARRALPAGGTLLCSFFVRPPGAEYFAVVARTANAVRRLRGAERAELGDAVGHNFVHSFTREEVEGELADGGFEVVSFASRPYGHAVARAAAPDATAAPAMRRGAAVGSAGVARPRPAVPVDAGGRASAAPAAPPLLALAGITKRWPRLDAPVLDRVDLALQPGATTEVVGRNGTGKTTLLRIAAGLIGPDDGSVTLAGLDPTTDRRAFQSRTAFLSAGQGGLYARLTVAWHLDWWGRLALIPAERRRALAAAALREFELEPLEGRRTDRLSTGQRQRLRLAGTFMLAPDVILLDEPASSLDGDGVGLLGRAVTAATARGAAVLWCAPSGTQPAIASDHRYVLEGGRIEPACD